MSYPQNVVPPQQYAPPASFPQIPPAQPPVAGTALSNRWLLSLVTTTLGGYLLVWILDGQFTQLLAGAEYVRSLGISFVLLLTLQFLFALAVVLLGLFSAPASLTRRGIAGGIVVLAVILIVILRTLRFSVGFGAATPFISFTFADPFVMLPLSIGAAWLVVRCRPALAFVALALVGIIAFVHWALLISGVDTATSTLVILLLGAFVSAGIGWGGVITSRLFSGNLAPATAPYAAAPQYYAPQHYAPPQQPPAP